VSCIRTHGAEDIVHRCASNHAAAPGCIVSFCSREDQVGTIISISVDFDDEVMGTDVTVLWELAPSPLTLQERLIRDIQVEEDRAYLRLMKDSMGA